MSNGDAHRLLESEAPCLTNTSNNRDNEVAPMHIPSHIITMQESTEEAEASIPTENVEDSPNPNGTFALCRKAAKRTLPWDLKAGELDLLSPPQAEDIPATKKRRLEEPFSATTDEAAAKISSHDTAVSLLLLLLLLLQMQLP
jgi:hypothetical protein